MILVFEMTWTGLIHAPGNSATLQVIARAFPEQQVRMHAEAGHLAALRGDAALAALPNVALAEIAVSERFRHRPGIASGRRMAQEYATVRAALRRVPRGEPCLVVLISATATAGFAAAWACRLASLPLGRRAVVQLGFHGNLNEALVARSRNPLRRAFDTRATLTARHAAPLRFLVLEEAIRAAMAGFAPAAAARTDVLPLPINAGELDAVRPAALAGPVRIGFVGLGTPDKGFDAFLGIAAAARARWGDRVEFVHVGRVPADWAGEAAGLLAQPVSRDPLPRAEFLARLGSLHYVLLPFRRGYYDLSASGALIDALTWLKPVIATRVPLTEQFFRDYGEIGLLCEDEAALGAAIDGILAGPDAARYDRQVAALAAARETRAVAALALRYRALTRAGFPGLLGSADATPPPSQGASSA